MKKDLAVQLYSLRKYAAKDFYKELEFVAEVGYKGVEPAGFWDIRPSEFRIRYRKICMLWKCSPAAKSISAAAAKNAPTTAARFSGMFPAI